MIESYFDPFILWGQYPSGKAYYHFGRLTGHGDVNFYQPDDPSSFDWRTIRHAAYKFAGRHGFKVETMYFPAEFKFGVARVDPPKTVFRLHSPKRTPYQAKMEAKARDKRRKRLARFTRDLAKVEPLTKKTKRLKNLYQI